MWSRYSPSSGLLADLFRFLPPASSNERDHSLLRRPEIPGDLLSVYRTQNIDQLYKIFPPNLEVSCRRREGLSKSEQFNCPLLLSPSLLLQLTSKSAFDFQCIDEI